MNIQLFLINEILFRRFLSCVLHASFMSLFINAKYFRGTALREEIQTENMTE